MGDAPEIEPLDIDVDENEDRFRRWIAVAVALLAFFGVLVAALQAIESNDEEVAARDAQRFAVTALGTEVDAQAQVLADIGIGNRALILGQRQATAFGRIERSVDATDVVHQAQAERLLAAAEAVQSHTPVDRSDPAGEAAITSAAFGRPDIDQLKERIRAGQASAHGGKADSYVAVLTVLAVGLFLLGLSLTVKGRIRWILAAPGVAVAVACVVATGLIARRPVVVVSDRSAELTAEGQLLLDAGDVDGAIELFDEAIDDSPEFGAPYARRSAARLRADAVATGQVGFQSIVSPDVLDDAIEDIERSLELGFDEDFGTVISAGFLAFNDGDFGRAAELARQAIALNDRHVLAHLNLATALIGLGEAADANDALQTGLALLENVPDGFVVSGLLGATRTDLELLSTIVENGDAETDADPDDVLDLVRSALGQLAVFEQELTCTEESPCDFVADDAAIELADVSRPGIFVEALFDVEDAELGEQIAFSWYFRGDDDQPFRQAAVGSMSVVTVSDFGSGPQAFTTGAAIDDPLCPVGTTYLVRAWAGDRLLGEVEFDVEPSALGEPFSFFEDQLLGFNICQPEGFEATPLDDADLVQQLGPQVNFFRDDESIFPVVVRGFFDPEVFDLDSAAGRIEAATGAVRGFLDDDDVDVEPLSLFGRSRRGVFGVEMPGVVGSGRFQGDDQTVFASVDETGTLRLISVSNMEDDEVQDVFRLAFFFDLPEPDQ